MISLQYKTIGTPLPDFIYDDLKEYSRNANRYQPQPEILKEKISEIQSIPKEEIYITAGADDAIQMFALAFGKSVHIFPPTYIVYKDVTDFYANVTEHPSLESDSYRISTDHIPGASLIILANPNNPCGWTAKEDVLKLAKNNSRCLILVDEVYAEFSDLSVIHDVPKYPNLAVIRSFSISYGMAGNRIGYVAASPHILSMIAPKAHSWANTSYLSVGAALSALSHTEYFQALIEDIISRRELFSEFLNTHGFTVIPSRINAVLIQFPSDEEGTRFAEHLQKNEIIVTHGGGQNNVGVSKSYVRIAIGTKEEMKTVEEIITAFKI